MNIKEKEPFRFSNSIEYNSKTKKWYCDGCVRVYDTAIEAVKCTGDDDDDPCGWRFDH